MAQEILTQSKIAKTDEALPLEKACLDEKEHPLARVLGVFKDDPMLDAMMENIREQRRRDEEDAQRGE